MSKPPQILVCGPASWNQLIELENLPEPRPQQLFARTAWSTVGGTSAGKALHLTSLGVSTTLITQIGQDEPGEKLTQVLVGAGLDLQVVPSRATEQHVNLMAGGQRVSIYVSTPDTPSSSQVDSVIRQVCSADLAVIDLSELGLRVLEQCGETSTELWVDLHDYDGLAEFHQPFLRAAQVVFMNDDATGDPWELLASCLQRGPKLAICTLGPRGAVALAKNGERFSITARDVQVFDTNGAGDAFMAGFLAAYLKGSSVQQSLESASDAATVAISSRHLHPVLEPLLPSI